MKRPFQRETSEDPRKCAQVRDLLTDYLDSDLGHRGKHRVAAHLSVCPGCRQALANLQFTVSVLKELRHPRSEGENAALADRVREAWRDRASA